MTNFVPITGLEGRYSVSRAGEIYSHRKNRVVTGSVAGRGYRYLVARLAGGAIKGVYFHRAVAEAFIPNPHGLPQVNHIDGDKTNNHADNLEWTTPGDNNRHAWAEGLCNHKGENHYLSKLTKEQVVEIKRRIALGESNHEIAADFPCGSDNIGAIRRGVSWKHI